MSEEEKKAIKTLADLKERKFYIHAFDNGTLVLDDDEIESIDMGLNLIEKQQKEIKHWKAGMKIVERDKSNHIERLEKELNNLKEIEKAHQEENGKLRVELEQKEQIIKRLEQDVDGYRDLSKQIQEDYSKQIRDYEEGYNE